MKPSLQSSCRGRAGKTAPKSGAKIGPRTKKGSSDASGFEFGLTCWGGGDCRSLNTYGLVFIVSYTAPILQHDVGNHDKEVCSDHLPRATK